MSAPKIIAKKIVGNLIYELRYWQNDNKYIIYKCDSSVSGKDAHRIPEVGVFSAETEARAHLDKI